MSLLKYSTETEIEEKGLKNEKDGPVRSVRVTRYSRASLKVWGTQKCSCVFNLTLKTNVNNIDFRLDNNQ